MADEIGNNGALWSQFYLTSKGISMRQIHIAEGVDPNGRRLQIGIARLGSGLPDDSKDILNMTDVLLPVRDGVVKKSFAVNENHKIIVHFDNTKLDNPIYVSEIGIMAKLSNETEWSLYGYTYSLGGYVEMRPQKANNGYELYNVGVEMTLGNATIVNLIYDKSTVYSTHKDLEDLMSQILPNTPIFTIPEAIWDASYKLEEMFYGNYDTLDENTVARNAILKKVPIDWVIDLEGDTTIKSTSKYAGMEFTVKKYTDNSYTASCGDIGLLLTRS